MKTITVMVPTYCEEQNIMVLYERTKKVFRESLSGYKCQILFVDNCSTDGTRDIIRSLCNQDKDVLAIFNVKNFGFSRSQFNGLRSAPGDAVVMMFADCQDPPEVIPELVKKWENGAKVVCGIKNKSSENPLLYFIRSLYYKLIKRISDVEHISQFDGFGLYDRTFIQMLQNLDDALPYFRGIVAEYGADRQEVFYKQEKRKFGKTHFHFMSLYDFAMLGITSYSKVVMHICTIAGAVISLGCIVISIITFVNKLLAWNKFSIGSAASQIGIYFLGAAQLFFIGFIGEYIANINVRVMHHPLVIEKERINFPQNNKKETQNETTGKTNC